MKPIRKKRDPHSRRGMAVLMVLLLLSLTVGLCYAAMRGQSTIGAIQRNTNRQATARQAAMTGLASALKKMHRGDWGGVGTSLQGSLGDDESFLTTYTAGDATLDAGDDDQPYRVTLLATGYAVDPQNPQSIASHRIRAVVRLIPRRLAPQPADFTAMKGYAVYQTKKHDTEIDIPCRFTGKIRLQDKLKIGVNYPNDNTARTVYFTDLNTYRLAGGGDYRPFNGPIHLPLSEQEGKYHALLSAMGIVPLHVAASESNTDWTKPAAAITYRIYPGGPEYAAQTVGAEIQAVALSPDAATNPLGVFFHDGPMTIGDNVTIEGSLFCTGDVKLAGTNIALQPPALPSLAGTSDVLRLAALSCANATVKAGAGGKITGLLASFGTFAIEKGAEDMTFALAGQLAAEKILVRQRTPWDTLNWEWYYNVYVWYYSQYPWSISKYFPIWMATNGRSPVPRLTFAPESSAAAYHWANSYDPIFMPHADDGGLRWDLVSWTENP